MMLPFYLDIYNGVISLLYIYIIVVLFFTFWCIYEAVLCFSLNLYDGVIFIPFLCNSYISSPIDMSTCPFCPSGDVHWRIVSVYLDKNSQVCCIAVKKIREIVKLSEWKQNSKFCLSIKRRGETNAKMWHMCCEPSMLVFASWMLMNGFLNSLFIERWLWNLRVNTWVLPW